MHTVSAKLTLHIPYAASLKDKRQVCRSTIDKSRKRFNASISEVDTHDVHQILTIGVSVVSGEYNYAQNSLNEIIRFIECNTEADLIEVEV